MTKELTIKKEEKPKPLRHQLTQMEIAITEQLPADIRYFVELRQERPVSTMTQIELKDQCNGVIVRAFMDFTPNKIEGEILTFQTLDLVSEFNKNPKFRNLTISEVKEAFRKGIRNEYGDFFGMCARTYHLFMQSYLAEQKRAEAWSKYLDILKQTEVDPAKAAEIKRNRSKQYLINLFEDYKSTGDLGVVPWAYCSTLAEFIGEEVEYAPGKFYKTFVTDPEIRSELELIAIEEYKKDLLVTAPQDRIYEKRTGEGWNNNLVRAVVAQGMKKEDALKNKMKEVALRWYFDKLIKDGKDLEL
jgi:uncharacterized protein (UPF0335 family)